MEEFMLELMYELPENATKGAKYVVDGEAIEHTKTLEELLVAKKESA